MDSTGKASVWSFGQMPAPEIPVDADFAPPIAQLRRAGNGRINPRVAAEIDIGIARRAGFS
jgi:hypothetical protein